MNMSEAAAYYGFSAAWSGIGMLPERTAYGLFRRGADRSYRRNGAPVRQLRKNLSRVVPDLTVAQMNDLVRENLRSHARYWCELFLMAGWSAAQVDDVDLIGTGRLTDSQRLGLGPICVGSHSGNYDHATGAAALRYGGAVAVAEPLKPKKLFDKFAAARAGYGIDVVAAGSDKIMDKLESTVRSGTLVALMGDRDLSRRGVPVTFFGQKTKMPAGAALLALRTGAPIVPVSFYYSGQRTVAQTCEPIVVAQGPPDEARVAAVTQKIADALAAGIAQHPQDWHMNQPLWLADLDPHRGGGVNR